MSIISDYIFDNMARIGADVTDNTQQNMSNTRYANYMLSNYHSSVIAGSHIQFATQQPNIMFGDVVHGKGINGKIVDIESALHLRKENERPLEKLQLFQRPFITVPYLGRGSCDPNLESQLLQGEMSSDKKSVSSMSEKSLSHYVIYNGSDSADKYSKVEEDALNGWIRGGSGSRTSSNGYTQK